MTAPAILQFSISRDVSTTYDNVVKEEDYQTIQEIEEKHSWWRSIFPRGYIREMKVIIIISVPLILTQLSQYSAGPLSLMFCGRLGKTELAAATMAISMINVLGLSIAVGLSTACDTLFSQIYGSKHKKKLGVVFIRSMIVIPLCVLPPLAMLLNAENFLLLLGQEEQVAKLASDYLLVFIPGLVGFFIYMPMAKYLQNQNIIVPSMIIGLISNVINVTLHFLLVSYAEYGLRGSAVSQMISYMSFPCLTLIYILTFKVYKDTWTGWSAECLLDWSQFFWLGCYGLLMVCIECWSFQVGLYMAGVLGTVELDSQAIIFQVETLAYMPVLGLGIAANIRIGQFLGSRDVIGAINCCRVVLSVTWILSILIAAIVCGLQDILPTVFTNIQDVIDMAASIFPWYSIVCLFEGTFAVCGGIFRGSGRQNVGAIVILVSYGVGLAVAIPVMLITHTVLGFWKGMVCAMAIEAAVFCIITVRTDWDNQAEKAMERISIATQMQLDQKTYETYELTEFEHHPLLPSGKLVTTAVYLRALAVVLIMIGVLLVGVMCRIYIPSPQHEVNPPFRYPNITLANHTYHA